MSGFTMAVASIAVGLSMGAVAAVGVTLAAEAGEAAPTPGPPVSRTPGPYLVDYGGRLPCNTVEGCLNRIPGLPQLPPIPHF